MGGRRKRYYHKTIVVKNVFGSTTVYAAVILLGAILLVTVLGQLHPALTRNTVMKSFDTVFGRTAFSFRMPTVYDRITEMIPMIQASEGWAKTLSAKNGGVKKEEKEQKVQEAVLPEKENIKSTDMSAKGISFRNETGYTPDASENLNRELGFRIEDGKPKVLIMHTHTSEAYAESEGARTTDNSKNVVRVGSVLAQTLEQKGISVIHDETRNDYPSYNGSYSKAMAGIAAQLEKNPSLEIVLDVHRDYAEQTKNGETVQLKPVAEVNGEQVAQVMFVVGTDGLGLSHPHWKENLAFAVQVQAQLQKINSKLARPVNLRRERFNQHLTKGSLIIEVGTAGNTIAECERAAAYVGKAIAAVLEKYQA